MCTHSELICRSARWFLIICGLLVTGFVAALPQESPAQGPVVQASDDDPGFTIRALKQAAVIEAGDTVYFGFEVWPHNGYEGAVTISWETDLEGVNVAKRRVKVGNTTRMRVITEPDLAEGIYTIAVTARAWPLSATTEVQVKVGDGEVSIVRGVDDSDFAFRSEHNSYRQIWIDSHQSVESVKVTIHLLEAWSVEGSFLLVSPTGEATGSGFYSPEEPQDLTLSFDFDYLNGLPAGGYWQLRFVNDVYGGEGIFDGWELEVGVEGPPVTSAPYALFSPDVRANNLVVFNDKSADVDDDIVSWFWDFGDGQTSTYPNPRHQYPGPGLYRPKLTVTDSEGNQNTTWSFLLYVEEPNINGWISQYSVSEDEQLKVYLRWEGSYRETVDIFRNGQLIASPLNELYGYGFSTYIDVIPDAGDINYTYRVCDRRPVCSPLFSLEE